MVAGDVYRPAAITQLEVIGKELDMPVFSMGSEVSPVTIAKEAIKRANALCAIRSSSIQPGDCILMKSSWMS